MIQAIEQAWQLLFSLDPSTWEIVRLSLQISITALLIGALIGLPLGAYLAIQDFPGRKIIITILNSLMGIPTVIVGVLIYLLLSRTGPLGFLGLLFTPKGIIIAQVMLTTPLIAALSRQTIEDAWHVHGETFNSLKLPVLSKLKWLLWDCRFSLSIAIIAGFARAISEVGAVMIVGGNIDRSTRTMTTAIALETSKGDLPLALALGIVLLCVVLLANASASILKNWAEKKYG
jgi:tungstate transport system permease protein